MGEITGLISLLWKLFVTWPLRLIKFGFKAKVLPLLFIIVIAIFCGIYHRPFSPLWYLWGITMTIAWKFSRQLFGLFNRTQVTDESDFGVDDELD